MDKNSNIKTYQTEDNCIHYTESPIFDSKTGLQLKRGQEIRDDKLNYIGIYNIENFYYKSLELLDDDDKIIYTRAIISNAPFTKKSKKRERNKMSLKLRYEILKRDRFRCVCCGERAGDVILEIDHIIPVSKGGKTEPNNLQTLCEKCNKGKSNSI